MYIVHDQVFFFGWLKRLLYVILFLAFLHSLIVIFWRQNEDLLGEVDFVSWNSYPSLAAHTHQPYPYLGLHGEGESYLTGTARP